MADRYGRHIDWQDELFANVPVITLYPFPPNVSDSLRHVYIAASKASEITEEVREKVVCYANVYGKDKADKLVPSVETLRMNWRREKKDFTFEKNRHARLLASSKKKG